MPSITATATTITTTAATAATTSTATATHYQHLQQPHRLSLLHISSHHNIELPAPPATTKIRSVTQLTSSAKPSARQAHVTALASAKT